MATPKQTYLSKRVAALVASGASAMMILCAFIPEKEGVKLQAYQDGARTWTICYGHTGGVRPTDRATMAMCEAWLKSDMGKSFALVAPLIKVPVTEPQLAGLVDFCGYNVGVGTCGSGTVIKKINAGQRQSGCDTILQYKYVGGKDCTLASSNCSGIILRRQQERELCLMD